DGTRHEEKVRNGLRIYLSAAEHPRYSPGMALSFRSFLWQSAKQAWASAGKAKQRAVRVAGFVTVAIGFLGIVLGDRMTAILAWIPFAAFVLAIIGAVFYYAYVLYFAAETGREDAVNKLADLSKPKVQFDGDVEGLSFMHYRTTYRVRVKNVS